MPDPNDKPPDDNAKLISRPLSSVDTGGLTMKKVWSEVEREQQRLNEANERASQSERVVGGCCGGLPPLPPLPDLPESQVGDSTAQSENTD